VIVEVRRTWRSTNTDRGDTDRAGGSTRSPKHAESHPIADFMLKDPAKRIPHTQWT